MDLRHPRPGNYYARVPATAACRVDNSKTYRLSARPKTRILDMSGAFGHVTFYYSARGGITPYRFQCRLDHQGYRPCTHVQKDYRHLRHGRHVFRVRAIGHNGKRDRTPPKRVFHTPT